MWELLILVVILVYKVEKYEHSGFLYNINHRKMTVEAVLVILTSSPLGPGSPSYPGNPAGPPGPGNPGGPVNPGSPY